MRRIGGKSQCLSRQMPRVRIFTGTSTVLPALSLYDIDAQRQGGDSPLSRRICLMFVRKVMASGVSDLYRTGTSFSPFGSFASLGLSDFSPFFFSCSAAAWARAVVGASDPTTPATTRARVREDRARTVTDRVCVRMVR